MKLKNIFIILIIFLLLICSVNAISAVSNDTSLEQSDDLLSSVTEANEENTILSDSVTDNVLKETSQKTSPYKQFCDDLNNHKKTVYLTGDIKISSSLPRINYNVVIDGQGHTIDGQSKTNILTIVDCTVTIKNTKFINGHSSSNGGAISSLKGNLNIVGCTFSKNTAVDNGGAIYSNKGTLTIKSCTFSKNTAVDNGGAIFKYEGNLNVDNSKFISNKVENKKSSGHGGAIIINNGNSKITNTIFKSNACLSKVLKKHSQATKYQFGGGAVYFIKGTLKLKQCTFSNNKASNDGGGVYGAEPKSLTIDKCTFNKNSALYEDGGAITFNGNKLVITNSKFTNNKAYEDGGVMDSLSFTKQKCYVTVKGCTFQGNTAYKGGGVFWMGVKTVYTMENNKFINNKASIGGVLFSEDSNTKISKCVFQGNKAGKITSWTVKTKAGGKLNHCGGAIMIQKRAVKIYKSTFKSNTATYGAVIFNSGGKLVLSGNKMSGNKAKSGGAVSK